MAFQKAFKADELAVELDDLDKAIRRLKRDRSTWQEIREEKKNKARLVGTAQRVEFAEGRGVTMEALMAIAKSACRRRGAGPSERFQLAISSVQKNDGFSPVKQGGSGPESRRASTARAAVSGRPISKSRRLAPLAVFPPNEGNQD